MVWQRSYSEAEALVAVKAAVVTVMAAVTAEMALVADWVAVATDSVARVATEDSVEANRRRYKKARTIGKPSSDWSMQHRVQR